MFLMLCAAFGLSGVLALAYAHYTACRDDRCNPDPWHKRKYKGK